MGELKLWDNLLNGCFGVCGVDGACVVSYTLYNVWPMYIYLFGSV